MPQNRRSFLASIGATAIAAAVAPQALAQTRLSKWGQPTDVGVQQKRKLERFGLQIYTVRSVAQADLPGTLEKIAQAGYKEVEFAGYYGKTPAEIRELLTKNGLTSPSTHVGLSNNPDTWKKALDDSKAIGHEFITVPSVPGGFDRAIVDGWKSLADRFNKAGTEAKAVGLRFAFHNHNAEFQDLQGTTPFDILIENTDPALVNFQVDIYWMTEGGRNILDYYAKHPTRIPMVHVKDRVPPTAPGGRAQMVDVGKGAIEWPKIFAVAVTKGTKHFFVEHDSPGADPIASVRASAEYLAKLEF